MIADSVWISRPKPNPRASLRLFCFPYAGGSSMIFRNWPDALPSIFEVCLVQLPGRGPRLREAPYKNMLALVEALAPEIRPYLQEPFAFFGHSMGAMISFELARELRRKYQFNPTCLLFSGRTAPQLPDTEPLTYNLPEAEFIEEVRRLDGTPREILVNPELMQLIMPVLRADFEACQTYSYQTDAPFDCPITALGGLQDREVKRADLEAWSKHTTGAFSLRMFPGDHFFLNNSQPLLFRVLSQTLYAGMTVSV